MWGILITHLGGGGGSWDLWGRVGTFGGELGPLGEIGTFGGSWDVWGEVGTFGGIGASPAPPP